MLFSHRSNKESFLLSWNMQNDDGATKDSHTTNFGHS